MMIGKAHTAMRCIIPPHMLQELAVRGDDQDRKNALRALALDHTFRTDRLITARAGAPPAPAQVAFTKQRRVYTANNTTNIPGTLVRSEGQPAGADVAVNETYDGFGSTFDLLANVYQRNSLDDAGMTLIGTVHFGTNYNNAAWNGTQMFFGDGDGKYFNRFTVAIDVIGHELAHGVTTHESDLEYRNQSGALNEHCSDVIGSLVKQYVAQETAAQADWIIGEGLFTSIVNGVGIRSMKAPGTAYDDTTLGKDPQPDHMSNYYTGTADNGGVHINSGIPNKAFYLAAIALGGNAWDRPGRIWYATIRDPQLGQNATFSDFAKLTVRHADALYGQGPSVVDAWRQVGIDVPVSAPGTLSGSWVLHYGWGCTGTYAQTGLSFNSDGTFGGGLAGKWRLGDGTVLLSFESGPAKYAGTLVGNIGTGAMSTFAGLDGCWYLSKQGTVGISS